MNERGEGEGKGERRGRKGIGGEKKNTPGTVNHKDNIIDGDARLSNVGCHDDLISNRWVKISCFNQWIREVVTLVTPSGGMANTFLCSSRGTWEWQGRSQYCLEPEAKERGGGERREGRCGRGVEGERRWEGRGDGGGGREEGMEEVGGKRGWRRWEGRGDGGGGREEGMEEVGGKRGWRRWEGRGDGGGGREEGMEEVGGKRGWRRWEGRGMEEVGGKRSG